MEDKNIVTLLDDVHSAVLVVAIPGTQLADASTNRFHGLGIQRHFADLHATQVATQIDADCLREAL